MIEDKKRLLARGVLTEQETEDFMEKHRYVNIYETRAYAQNVQHPVTCRYPPLRCSLLTHSRPQDPHLSECHVEQSINRSSIQSASKVVHDETFLLQINRPPIRSRTTYNLTSMATLILFDVMQFAAVADQRRARTVPICAELDIVRTGEYCALHDGVPFVAVNY